MMPRHDVRGGVVELDQAFDRETLQELREAVLAAAVASGMSGDRAALVMLAVHELAANTIVHGGGAGRARMRVAGEELYCHVSDTGPDGFDDEACASAALPGWSFEPGHGLWLVRNAADQVRVAAGLDGSEVTAVFALPGISGRPHGQ